MKKNTTKPIEHKEEKRDENLYTIVDRYLNFCSQAHLDSGKIRWDEKYLNCWFSY